MPLGKHHSKKKKCQDMPRTLERQRLATALGHVCTGVAWVKATTPAGPHTLSPGVSKVCPGISSWPLPAVSSTWAGTPLNPRALSGERIY